MNAASYSADVYISYAGNDEGDEYENSRDDIVKKICAQLENQRLRAREYKRDVGYKDSIDAYMLNIANADYIVLLISDKYLKSEYCMYEAIELLSRNKENLKEKIFPVLMPDSNIFKMSRRVFYVDFWEKQFHKGQKMLEGKDPMKYASLFQKQKVIREISENIDEFLGEVAKLCQLSETKIFQNNYQSLVDSILKQVSAKQTLVSANLSAMSPPAANTATIVPQTITVGEAEGLADRLKQATELISLAMGKIKEKVMDSESARKEFIDIHFEEISGPGEISPATLGFIYSLRTDKDLYEPYRQSLIISALSLGLIRKYDEKKARLLLDFATDDDPVLSYRALAGVVLGLLAKEAYISNEVERKLKTLQDNAKIQRCLMSIFFLIGNQDLLQKIAEATYYVDFSKFEFFDSTQHWFQPFYKDNPIVRENVADKQLAKILVESVFFIGINSLRYALALQAPNLPKESIENIKEASTFDKQLLGAVQSDVLREKLLLEAEVSKYIFEFYVYASKNNEEPIVALVENKNNLSPGYLYDLVLNNTSQTLLTANRYYINKDYAEACEVIKAVLEEQPNHTDAMLLQAYSLYPAGRFAEAIPVLEKIRSKGIQESQILAMLGDSYFNTRDYEKAIEAYTALLTVQDNEVAQFNIGRSYQLKENPDHEKALSYYKKLVEKAPEDYRSLIIMGDYYLSLTPPDYATAITWYDKALYQKDDDINLIRAYANCLVNLKDFPLSKAEKLFNRWIELEPQNLYPYLALGDCYANNNPSELDSAFAFYFKGFETDKKNLALIKFLDGFFEKYKPEAVQKVKEVYDSFFELEPDNVLAYVHFSRMLATQHEPDFEAAFNYCFRAHQIKSSPELIETLLDCAVFMQTPPEEKIAALYKEYKAFFPNDTKPELIFANYHLQKKQPDYQKALELYEQAKTGNPADEELLVKLGAYYQQLPTPDYEASVRYLDQALAIDPDDALAHFHHGWADFVTGNIDAAKTHFEKAYSPTVNEGLVDQNLGHLALCSGDAEKAVDYYQKSIAFFESADAFYSASISDFIYLEKYGIDRTRFQELLEQAMETIKEKAAIAEK